jgi:hypothetical protein
VWVGGWGLFWDKKIVQTIFEYLCACYRLN